MIQMIFNLSSHLLFIFFAYYLLMNLVQWEKFLKVSAENAVKIRFLILMISVGIGYLASSFFITPKMKKMILVLAGAIIAGGAIFAIQSYASSQDTPLNESEINKLKSTYPKNNNRLTAEMWDSMLDLLARINNNIPDTSIW